MSVLRVLLVRLSAVGDCVHAMPVACALREAFEGAHIGWVVDDRAAAVVRGHPALSRLHVLPRREGDKLSFAKGMLLRRDPDREATAQILREAVSRLNGSQPD